MNNFSERLKKLREESNFTQSQLADLLSTDSSKIFPQNISYWEKGRQPSFEILSRLALCFDVTTDYLVGKSEFKNFKEELEHYTTVEKLKIENNASLITTDEREKIINSINLLYNSLVKFFSYYASENNVLKSNTPHGDIVFNGAIVFDVISNFSRIINIISELYKVSAHTYKYENLLKSLNSYYEMPIDRSKNLSECSQQEILELNERSVELAKIQEIIQNSNIALGLKNSIIDCIQTILKSYIPEDMYY